MPYTDWPLSYQAIYVFGFGVPLFNRDVGSSHKMKWGLLIIHNLLLASAYGFILFVHFSKWREKLPRKCFCVSCSYLVQCSDLIRSDPLSSFIYAFGCIVAHENIGSTYHNHKYPFFFISLCFSEIALYEEDHECSLTSDVQISFTFCSQTCILQLCCCNVCL